MPSWTPDRIASCGIWTAKKPRGWRTSRRPMLQAGRRSKPECQGHAKPQRDTHARWCRVLAGPTSVSSSHAEAQRHGTFGVVATCLCDRPSTGKFLRFCIASPCIVAWCMPSTHPGRHWPACFDQTGGYAGEGPLTTLDSPGAPAISLTPAQEIRTCERKTKGKLFGNEVCRPCESPLQPKQNEHTCTKCHAWACWAACGRAVVDLHCCRLTGVVSRECINQSHTEGFGGSTAEGTPRATQSWGQAVDVWMADMPCDQQERARGLPSCAPGGASRLSRSGSYAHKGCDRSADAD